MTVKSWLIILTSFVAPSAYASTQARLTQLVEQAPTVTSIQSQVGAELAATGITLAIRVVSANGLVVPDGTVAVSDGSVALDSVPIINGTATVTAAFSSLGAHQLIACYSGDSNFSSSCSSPKILTALAPYTLQQSTPTGVVENANPFIDKLSVIPAKGFVGVVQLVCQVPSGQCGLSPSSVSFSGDGKPQVVKASFVPSPSSRTASFIALPLMGFIGFRIRRKYNPSRFLTSLLAAAMLLGLAGCGPTVSFPFDSTTVMMRVNATSGAFGQAVMYQIQVDTSTANQ
jgi:hypothetical protein